MRVWTLWLLQIQSRFAFRFLLAQRVVFHSCTLVRLFAHTSSFSGSGRGIRHGVTPMQISHNTIGCLSIKSLSYAIPLAMGLITQPLFVQFDLVVYSRLFFSTLFLRIACSLTLMVVVCCLWPFWLVLYLEETALSSEELSWPCSCPIWQYAVSTAEHLKLTTLVVLLLIQHWLRLGNTLRPFKTRFGLSLHFCSTACCSLCHTIDRTFSMPTSRNNMFTQALTTLVVVTAHLLTTN